MLVNFVRVSTPLVLNSAKPWLIFTQPPRRGGRRLLGSPVDGDGGGGVGLRASNAQNLAQSHSLSVVLCSPPSPGRRRWAAAVAVADRPPSPSHLSLSLMHSGGQGGL